MRMEQSGFRPDQEANCRGAIAPASSRSSPLGKCATVSAKTAACRAQRVNKGSGPSATNPAHVGIPSPDACIAIKTSSEAVTAIRSTGESEEKSTVPMRGSASGK